MKTYDIHVTEKYENRTLKNGGGYLQMAGAPLPKLAKMIFVTSHFICYPKKLVKQSVALITFSDRTPPYYNSSLKYPPLH